MNTTIESTSLLMNPSNSDNFAIQLRNACQLFRFYSSIILVVVGREYFYDINRSFQVFLLIFLGMIGSLLSIKVFSSTKIRRNSSNEYLITSRFRTNRFTIE